MSPVIAKLVRALQESIEGEVRFDHVTCGMYAQDASNYRQIPFGVILPKTREDIIRSVAICREFDVPILSRGAGTSIAGQTVNEAVILDYSMYYRKILEFHPESSTITVQPGIVLDQLNKHIQSHGLIFGPDPATHSRCTLGGMIGNNSCGIHSILSGKTAENVESLEILTYDGTILRVGKTSPEELQQKISAGGREGQIYSQLKHLSDQYAPLIKKNYPTLRRRVSGYNLEQLLPENHFHVARALVGTEGTCMVILSATLKLVKNPKFKNLLLLGYSDVFSMADDAPRVCEFRPDGYEGLDEKFIGNMRIKGMHTKSIAKLPEGNCWALIEFSGENKEEAKEKAEHLIRGLKSPTNPSMKLFEESSEVHTLWAVRESAFGATMFVLGQKDIFAGWEDAAVPPEKLGEYLRAFHQLIKKYDYQTVIYGHFGEGCLHSRVSFDLVTRSGISSYRSFIHDCADLTLRLGGSLSGEHGDGQARAELLPKMFGPELVEAFSKFKAIWDPKNKMNPGKIVNAYRMDENLKYLAPENHPQTEKLTFSYVEDKGDFFTTLKRCIGIGRCRKQEDGMMCPSYMATLDEKHSTRGRAHGLYEMLRGETSQQGWNDPLLKESLDLCLSCKGCKSECPTGVDMAAYKAEFLHHYHQKNPRSLQAYAFSYIRTWLSITPRWLHKLAQIPWIENFIKRTLHMTQERSLPKISNISFKQWFDEHDQSAFQQKPGVLLFTDTFHLYFQPQVLISATKILNHFGFRVSIPSSQLCCGRPFYDYGMLDQAKVYLHQLISQLVNEHQPQTTPIILLEPGCLSVFRDELIQIFPQDSKAKQLSKSVYSLSEFLLKHSNSLEKKTNHQPKIKIHAHCHQKALWGSEVDKNLFQSLGLDTEVLNTGCCGMAGPFGYDEHHYEVSKKIAEQDLLKKIPTAKDTNCTLVSDGFSCRSQVTSLSQTPIRHTAEILDILLLNNQERLHD